MPVITAHTDVVGSLLRPPELLKARDDLAAGQITPADFKKVEDRAVDAAVKLQEDAGLYVVTDGEMRRLSFQSALTDAVDGFGDVPLEAFLWGDWHSEVLGEMDIARPPELGVTAKLKRRHHLAA
jgi:5-methyltetrahydropteroyltriglutamate--homocysteine methyltransferase